MGSRISITRLILSYSAMLLVVVTLAIASQTMLEYVLPRSATWGGHHSSALLLLALQLAALAIFSLLVFRPLVRRLRAEAQQLELLALVASQTDNAVIITDARGCVEWVNAGFTRMTGYTCDEVHGKKPGAFLQGPATDPEAIAVMRHAIEARQSVRVELVNYHKNGHPYWVSLAITPVQDPDGQLCRFIAIESDISAQKDLEQSLRSALKEAADLTNALNQAAIVALTDRCGRIIDANELFCAISGYRRDELLGQDHRIIKSGIHPMAFMRELWQTIARGQVWRGEICNRARNGHFYWVDTTIVPFLDPTGKPERYLAIRFDITERKQAEAAVRASEQQYRALHAAAERQRQELELLDQVRSALARELDLERIYRVAVEAIPQVFGYTLVSLYTRGSDTLVPRHQVGYPTSLPAIPLTAGVCGRVLRTGTPELLPNVQRDPDFLGVMEGITSEICVPLVDDQGQPLGVLNVESTSGVALTTADLRLMTALSEQVSIAISRAQRYAQAQYELAERKQAEAALRESETRYRSVVAALVEGIVLQNADGSIQACNASAERILGLSTDQMTGRTSVDPRWRALRDDGTPFPGEAHPAMVALATGQPLTNVIMGVHKPDDSYTWISINAQPLLRDGEDQPFAVVTSFFDITAQRQAAQELRFQKTLLEAQSEASIDGILVVSPERRWLYANRRFAELWSFDAAIMTAATSAVGQPAMLRQVVDPERVRAEIEHLYQQPELHGQGEMTLRDERTFEWYSAPVHDLDGTFYGRVWYYRDISERKAVERMKNEFVSVVSHELRTPLTSIRGALGLIAGGVVGTLPPQVASMVTIALKNSERLVRLINDILDIEKIESGKMRFQLTPLALVPLLTQALEANRAYAEQLGVTLTLSQPTPDLWVSADADRLTQVITNLLSNAAKFSPPGATVLLALAHLREGWVRISVTDRGPGIPEEFRARIFQKFAQADASSTRQQGGTGLGLSISKAIVERHGGQIGFCSDPGNATTFYVDLPVWQALPVPAPNAIIQQPRILVCEDDPDVATLLALLLRGAGLHSDIAATADQARQLLASGSYAGLTLDIALPDSDGIALIRSLRDDPHTRDLPVVVVSALADQTRHGLQGDALGIVDWLTKPIDQRQLVAAVMTAVQRTASHHQLTVLHVEDDPDIVTFTSLLLTPVARIVAANDIQAARTLLQHERFDLVILDLELPDGCGYDLLPLLHTWVPPIPALIFSAQEVGPNPPQHVAGALVKSRTSNETLRATIMALLGHSQRPTSGDT